MPRRSVKRAVGARLRDAVRSVVDPQATQLRDEIAGLREELRETRNAIAQAVLESEVRHRRDVVYAGELRAVAETEHFVAAHLTGVPRFPDPEATLRHALAQVSIPGLVLEFGVASGTTLRHIVEELPGREIFGFDVFTGLPEAWRPGFPAGMFAQDPVPDVPGATLVRGLFDETLPGFLDEHPGNIAFLHLDADLYSSTKTVLDLVGDRLVPGTVVVLDEYFNYPGWQDGEYRAWAEFATNRAVGFEYLGYTFNNEQVALAVTE